MQQLTHKEQKERINETIKQSRYYLVIVISSLVGLILLPALKVSDGDIGFVFPKTQVEWFIWAFSRVAVIILSVSIFFSFTNQGQLRAVKTREYKQAEKIMIALSLVKATEKKNPISPYKWDRMVKTKKVATMVVMSVTTFIAFGQLILGFDIATFLSYLLTIGMGIVFGVMQMFDSEDMWSYGYLEYAEWKQKLYEKESKEKLAVEQVKIEESNKYSTEEEKSKEEPKIESNKENKKENIFDKIMKETL